ncbi:hypothetical protein HNY73_012650 [Argiope bruennichi]|uniref:Uncharacterized protein n=1 Tax=Argiope bruennichi TaxID=94029 RepID=A0A8T0EXE9_ARGBR|nr:hypothetical protein HNY73_012650 [Argiope bruennichi]
MQGARQAFMLLWGWEREGLEKKDQWLDDQRSKLPETAPACFRWSHAFHPADGEPARLPFTHREKTPNRPPTVRISVTAGAGGEE